jgi:hypothetical protein
MTVSSPKSNSTLESPAPVAPRSHQKPQADLYTILLVFALIAVLVAILYLYLYMKSYNFEAKGGPAVTINSGARVDEESGRVGEWETGRRGDLAQLLLPRFSRLSTPLSPNLPLSPSYCPTVSYS